VPAQHGHLLGCFEIVPETLRLELNFRQAPLPRLFRNRVHHRFAAFFLEKTVRTPQEKSSTCRPLSKCGEKIRRLHGAMLTQNPQITQITQIDKGKKQLDPFTPFQARCLVRGPAAKPFAGELSAHTAGRSVYSAPSVFRLA
jgi:hypothetical protein